MRALKIIVVLLAGLMLVIYFTDPPLKVLYLMGLSILEFILICIVYDDKVMNGMPEDVTIDIDGIRLNFPVKQEKDGIITQNDLRVNFKAGKGDISPFAVQVWHEEHERPMKVSGFITLAGETIPVTCNKFLSGQGHHYHGEFRGGAWRGTLSFYTQFNGWKQPTVRIQTQSI